MGDSIERMLEFYAVVKLESDADEDEGGEDGVELETVWVVVRCVDGVGIYVRNAFNIII